ncbi:jg19761 [Pararge aegeria aegeria]|uniref:Jg19761 protein n=1 Tax=Pararge aegeria aegeria TaxID=348720 RepID=A0A8S4QGE8_9NEOP|nr:jg19761 [Pararge aegeria aegeria]
MSGWAKSWKSPLGLPGNQIKQRRYVEGPGDYYRESPRVETVNAETGRLSARRPVEIKQETASGWMRKAENRV